MWNSFDDKRFKSNCCITKGTFLYRFGEVGDLLTRETVCEEPSTSSYKIGGVHLQAC